MMRGLDTAPGETRTDRRFYLHDGQLTSYALACGYVQSACQGKVGMGQEHGTYLLHRWGPDTLRIAERFATSNLSEARIQFRRMSRIASTYA
jgi:hypothetical protein